MRFCLVVSVAIAVCSGYADEGFGCPTNLNLTDEVRKTFLDTHNDLRRNVAHGKQENLIGFLAPAKNMYALKWDCDLEEQAQNSLSKCTLTEDVKAGRNNIAMTLVSTFPDDIYVSLAMNNWISPVKFFGKPKPTNAYDGSFCQFANMVHANTTKMGCAYKRCGEQFLVTCLYDKCGTIPNGLMWEEGEACMEDDECTTFYGSECHDGLCVLP
ncbi:SCP-like protein [Ancylostoma caninum]|uniref:SCP-like protein n=1 Tax=Ancylostoma caninum TaxID=29170 RepID=A0A368FNP7_ANCCA|nr:SCP-like protein [Ancylostoma caninum]